ncbi:MAG: methyltransferase protein [Cyanobacteria bacterium RYN_339]|nr:methyltransferase protein [Cyanobacteria bacterium RYN_339]
MPRRATSRKGVSGVIAAVALDADNGGTMTFIDLKKRLSAKKTPPAPIPVPEVAAPVVAVPVVAVPEIAVPEIAVPVVAVPMVAEPEVAEPEVAVPVIQAPALSWEPRLLDVLSEPIGRTQDVLLVGLGPWGREVGTRGLAEALLGRARTVVAVDPDKARLASARGFLQRTHVADLAAPDLVQQLGRPRYDVVVVTDALVLLPEPLPFLRSLAALLNPDGQVLAVVPNMAHADKRLALLNGDAPREFEPGAPRHHYTRQRLRELFAFAGFALTGALPFVQAPLGADSGLVPELFPPGVLAALGPSEDAQAAYFVVRAVAAPADRLMRVLFDEQSELKRVVRNEMAVALQTSDDLTRRLKEAEYTREQALVELAEARRKEAALDELVQRADQNIKRLGKEVDQAQRELTAVKASFWYRVGQFFKRQAAGHTEFAANEPAPWKYDIDGRKPV